MCVYSRRCGPPGQPRSGSRRAHALTYPSKASVAHASRTTNGQFSTRAEVASGHASVPSHYDNFAGKKVTDLPRPRLSYPLPFLEKESERHPPTSSPFTYSTSCRR